MPPKNNKNYYLSQNVADKFGISKKTLLGWEKDGKISKPPKDWRGWRMYGENHINEIKKVIDEKRKNII